LNNLERIWREIWLSSAAKTASRRGAGLASSSPRDGAEDGQVDGLVEEDESETSGIIIGCSGAGDWQEGSQSLEMGSLTETRGKGSVKERTP
jgi:hypothetical protein